MCGGYFYFILEIFKLLLVRKKLDDSNEYILLCKLLGNEYLT